MPKEPIELEQAIRGFAEEVRADFGLEARSDSSASQDGTTTIAGLSPGAEGQRQAADVADPAQVRAVARAMDSFDDAAAYGLLVRNIERADVDTQMAGQARVDGTGEAEGRGLSIGLQEFLDPDEVDGAGPGANDGGGDEGEAFGPGPEDALPRLDGAAETGAGNDRVTGHLDARGGAVGDDGEDGLSAGDADLEMIADRLENVGLIDLGEGDDRLVGTAEADAAGAGSRAVGLFVGEDGSVVSGAGGDRIEGRAEILGPGEGFSVAGEETGRIETGEGRDVVGFGEAGFGGGLTVALGAGDDVARGFGDERLEGGEGHDTLQIGMAFGEFARSGEAGAVEDGVTLENGGFEMIATGIESFDFEGEVLTAEELLARISETPEAPTEEEPAPVEPVLDAPDPDEPPVGLV